MDKRPPWERDLRAYTYAAMASLAVFVFILAAGGMALKHDRKGRTIAHQGCYLWSDGTTQCGWRQ